MLEAVRALCERRGVPAQLALESGMACGFGACFGCVVPTLRRLRAAVRRRSRARRGRGLGVHRMTTFCGIERAHPIVNGSGTFDAIAARRAFGDALLELLPVRGVRLEDRHARAARGQPAAAAVVAGRLLDQTLSACPNKGLDGYSRYDLPQLAQLPVPLIVNVMGFTREEVAPARGGVRRTRGGRGTGAERLLPERRDGARHGRRSNASTAALVQRRAPAARAKPLIVKLTSELPAIRPPRSRRLRRRRGPMLSR